MFLTIKQIFTQNCYLHLADSKATYSAFRLYIFYQYVCSLGIEPMTFCTANAMLYHWATGTVVLSMRLDTFFFSLLLLKFLINVLQSFFYNNLCFTVMKII